MVAARDFIPTLPDPVFSPEQYRTVREAIGELLPLQAGGKDPSKIAEALEAAKKAAIELLG